MLDLKSMVAGAVLVLAGFAAATLVGDVQAGGVTEQAGEPGKPMVTSSEDGSAIYVWDSSVWDTTGEVSATARMYRMNGYVKTVELKHDEETDSRRNRSD